MSKEIQYASVDQAFSSPSNVYEAKKYTTIRLMETHLVDVEC